MHSCALIVLQWHAHTSMNGTTGECYILLRLYSCSNARELSSGSVPDRWWKVMLPSVVTGHIFQGDQLLFYSKVVGKRWLWNGQVHTRKKKSSFQWCDLRTFMIEVFREKWPSNGVVSFIRIVPGPPAGLVFVLQMYFWAQPLKTYRVTCKNFFPLSLWKKKGSVPEMLQTVAVKYGTFLPCVD